MTPHSVCLVDPALIWLSFWFDLMIMAAYFLIPVVLMAIYAVRPRSSRWTYSMRSSILVLFAAFIFACGTSHMFEAITVFIPWYWAEVIVKGVTASISLWTAVFILRKKGSLVSFPSRIEKDYEHMSDLQHRISLLVQNH
jgi:hypothetical protein